MTPVTNLYAAESKLRGVERMLSRREAADFQRLATMAEELREQLAAMKEERGLAAPWQVRRARYLRATGKYDQLRAEGL